MFHFIDKETETEIEGTCQEVVGQSSPTHLYPSFAAPTTAPTAVTGGKKSHLVATGLQSREEGPGLHIMRRAFDCAFDSCLYWCSAMGCEVGHFLPQTAISGSLK